MSLKKEMDPQDASLLELFSQLPDPRSKSGLRHSLEEVLLITVLAVICGADDWIGVEQYGKLQQSFLEQFIEMPHGIAQR